MGDGSLSVLAPTVGKIDGSYYEDFWTKEGYLGYDQNGTAVRDRIQMDTVITDFYAPSEGEIAAEHAYRKKTEEEFDGRNGVDDSWKKMVSAAEGQPWIKVADPFPGENPYLTGLKITITDGEAKGNDMQLGYYEDGKIYLGTNFGSLSANDILRKIKVGDRVHFDNSNYIAIQTYHRHQVPEREYKVWDQFRNPDGTPKYPQRNILLCYGFASSGCGSLQSGDFHGKMICLSSLADDSAFPWMADWYRQKVKQAKGLEGEESFRLWYNEHCCHGPQYYSVDETTVTSYGPALYQALLDVSDWVERGIEPAQSTQYTVDDGQVIIEAEAKKRKGIQPVIKLLANGAERTCVKVGEPVEFQARITMPEHAGFVTVADLTFDGKPAFGDECQMKLENQGKSATVTASHAYKEAGTYFATIRVKASRDGNRVDKFTQIQNIAMARVVVEDSAK